MKLLILALLPAAVLCAPDITTPVDPTDEPVVFAVEKANELLISFGRIDESLALTRILDASKQVVSLGEKWHLTLKLGDFECRVSVVYRALATGALQRLLVDDGPTCNRAVHSRLGCSLYHSGPKPFSDAPLFLQGLLYMAVCSWNDKSTSEYLLAMKETAGITFTTEEHIGVVNNGTHVYFNNVELAESQCRKHVKCTEATMSSCKIPHGGYTEKCFAAVDLSPVEPIIGRFSGRFNAYIALCNRRL